MKKVIEVIKSDNLFSRGQDLASKGRLDEALTAFDQALLLNPGNGNIWLHKALALSDQQKYQDSVTALQKAIDLNPSNPVLYMFMGRIHYDNQYLDESITALDKSLSLDSENLLTRCLRNLVCLTRQFDAGASQEIKKEYANTNSEFQSRLLFFCETYLKTHPEKARTADIPGEDPDSTSSAWQFLDKLIYSIYALNYRVRYSRDADKKSAYLHYLDGVKYSSTSNTAKAIEEFKKALQLHPDLGDAREQLIELYFQTKNYVDILEYLERDHSNSPGNSVKPDGKTPADDAEAYMSGVAYYHLGRYAEAVEKLKTVVNHGTPDYRPFYYLGLCHLASGNNPETKTYFRKAVDGMEPGFLRERLDEMNAAYSSAGDPSAKS